MSKGYPKKVNINFNVPANANYASIALPAIPANETWRVCLVAVNSPALVTLSDFSINGVPVGMYVAPGVYGEFSALVQYGEPLDVGPGGLSIHATSTSASIVAGTLSIYAFITQHKV
ncbi:hypothetical protein D3C81_1635600 [compost metagenome]